MTGQILQFPKTPQAVERIRSKANLERLKAQRKITIENQRQAILAAAKQVRERELRKKLRKSVMVPNFWRILLWCLIFAGIQWIIR